jgi:hypothetical protein
MIHIDLWIKFDYICLINYYYPIRYILILNI